MTPLGRWTKVPALAPILSSPTTTSSSSSSTQKASSSRWCMCGGTSPCGGTVESVSAYFPPVSSPEITKVINSSATHSFLPSPGGTWTTPFSLASIIVLLISAPPPDCCHDPYPQI